jgi:hypothetical protein
MIKKTSAFLALFFATFAASQDSYAASRYYAANRNDSGFYLGIDGVGSHVKNTYINNLDNTGFYDDANRTSAAKDSLGYGINLGARADFGVPSASIEIFYDQLSNVSRDPLIATEYHDKLTQNAMTIDNRYGVKANLGLQIANGVEVFAVAGLTNIRYRYDRYDLWNGSSSKGTAFKAGTSQFVPIYGVGLRFNMTDRATARVLYETQKMNNQYSNEWENLTSKISTLKIGMAYGF